MTSPLDRLWAQDSDDARRRFYALLAETALLVPIDAAEKPLSFALEPFAVTLAFDDDARLAAFFDAPTGYVAMGGAALAAALAEAGLGLLLNPEGEAGALLPPEALRFVAEQAPAVATAEDIEQARLARPDGASPALVAALSARAADMAGLVRGAWLARLEGGSLLLLVDLAEAARRGAEGVAATLARAAAPYCEQGDPIAVAAPPSGHAAFEQARACGVDLMPKPAAPADRPPILR